jgi:hypothetical protein
MNRIVLKVGLLENHGVRLDLYHLDPRFISDEKFLSFNTNDFDFLIYSRKKMSICVNSLRLPGKKYYKEHQYIEHKFDNESERYNFLKGLYKCLHEWSDNYTEFTKGNDYERRNRKLIMSGEYWII